MRRSVIAVAALMAAGVADSASAAVRADHPAVTRALAQLRDHADEARSGAADRFQVRDLLVDANGTSHVRLDRRYAGLRVIGGDLVVHSDAAGRWAGASQTLARRIDIATTARVSRAEALQLGESRFAGERSGTTQAELVVYARQSQPVLAWDVTVNGYARDGMESAHHSILHAATRAVLDEWDDVKTAAAAGTGRSLMAGTVALTSDSQNLGYYVLRDPTRGSHYVCDMQNLRFGALCASFSDGDNVWGSGSTSNRATVAVDAAYGQQLTWDYYLSSFGRRGIANDGKGAYSRVHYRRGYVNAFWSDSCFCMTYGDANGTLNPLVSIDVAAHEMTHGVTSRTAALIYSGESGGLNEAMSDIFATLVEFYAANPIETPNYLIGERIYPSSAGNPAPKQAFRYMFKPSLDGRSADCYSADVGGLDVHYSSGVANHFFYLLTQGAVVPDGGFALEPADLVCNGNTELAAISRDKAAQILYRALTVYMTSSTDYAGARVATLSAATDLYGLSSAERAAVDAAWSAVGVDVAVDTAARD